MSKYKIKLYSAKNKKSKATAGALVRVYAFPPKPYGKRI
jgi:hypothetical protein